MKVWGTALLMILASCAAPSRSTPPPAAASELGTFVDALRVDREYRPAPQGSECFNCFFELPSRAYIAQGWGTACCAAWPSCCHRPAYWRRSCLD